MCSSNNGMSPFSQVSPFWNWNPSSSFCSLNEDDNQDLLHHHQDLLSYCLAVAPIIDAETTAVSVSTKKKTSAAKRDQLTAVSASAISTNSSKKKKATAKRERHSKILTAQGPRDRRVRLSIEISRKFFGLQDSLGFDKASSTLDWLLTKSKTAIKELIQTRQIDNDAINATRLCSSLYEDDNNNGDFVAEGDSKRKSTKKEKPKMQTAADKIAKESRAKARERARERTREKNFLRLQILCQQQHNLISFNNSYQMGTFCRSTKNSSRSSSNEINATTTTSTDKGFFFGNNIPRNVAGESSVRNMKISKPNCLQRNLHH